MPHTFTVRNTFSFILFLNISVFSPSYARDRTDQNFTGQNVCFEESRILPHPLFLAVHPFLICINPLSMSYSVHPVRLGLKCSLFRAITHRKPSRIIVPQKNRSIDSCLGLVSHSFILTFCLPFYSTLVPKPFQNPGHLHITSALSLLLHARVKIK